jgi:hypothetical protein
VRIGGQILALHDIPLALILNIDETGAQLINVAKRRTFAKKGAKRVRLVGIGKDKAGPSPGHSSSNCCRRCLTLPDHLQGQDGSMPSQEECASWLYCDTHNVPLAERPDVL